MDIVLLAMPLYNEFLQKQQDNCSINTNTLEVKLQKDTRVVVEKDDRVVSVYPTGLSTCKISLPDGKGVYTIKIVNEFNDIVRSKEITSDAKLLSSTTMVNFNKLIKYSKDINTTDDIKKFIKKLDYSTTNYVPKEYVPNLAEVIDRGYGVCVDYASLYCAFCRLNGIECRMVYGYRDGAYHAWCEEKRGSEYKLVDLLADKEHEYKPMYYY